MDTQSMSQVPPPLALVKDDDPQVVEAANTRVPKKSRLSRLFSWPRSRSRHDLLDTDSRSEESHTPPETEPQILVSGVDTAPISLDNSALLGQDVYQDRYEWAVVYENQRGSVLRAFECLTSILIPC